MPQDFLKEMSSSIAEYERRATRHFAALSEDQLNWSPAPGRWGVGKCLEHLVKANSPYFTIFDEVVAGTHPKTFWQRLPLWPAIWGKLVLDTVHPNTVRKSKAPRIFRLDDTRVPVSILGDFLAQQRRLAEAFAALQGVDVDKTIVTSPVAVFIPYSLRHAISIVIMHEERHLQQAVRALHAMPK